VPGCDFDSFIDVHIVVGRYLSGKPRNIWQLHSCQKCWEKCCLWSGKTDVNVNYVGETSVS